MLEAIFILIGSVVCLAAIFGGVGLVMRIAETKYVHKLAGRKREEEVVFEQRREKIEPPAMEPCPEGIVSSGRMSGLTDEEIIQVWMQGMVLRSAGARVYSPEQMGQRIMGLDEEFGIREMWLALFKPADLESPFYDLMRWLVERGVQITYLVPESALEIVSHLRKKLKRDKKLKIDPKDVDQRVLDQVVDEDKLAKNTVFVTAGKGAMERRLGFECIRDDNGRTCLIYDMPLAERQRLWPATKPKIFKFAKGKEVG